MALLFYVHHQNGAAFTVVDYNRQLCARHAVQQRRNRIHYLRHRQTRFKTLAAVGQKSGNCHFSASGINGCRKDKA